MRVERVAGAVNVLRFPVERRARPTLELMSELAPDAWDISDLVETYRLEPPPSDLQETVDEDTAEFILNQVPPAGPERAAALDDLEKPAIASAIAACRAMWDAWATVSDARVALSEAQAQTSEQLKVDLLEDRIRCLTEQAARLVVEAWILVAWARGVVRAVGFARRDEPWMPRDYAADDDALIEMGRLRAGSAG